MTDRRTSRAGTLVWLVGVVVASLLLGALVATMINMRDDVRNLTAHADESDADIETLSNQLKAIGVEPAIDANETIERGEQGDQGSDGRDGRDGQDGADGRDGTDGAPGDPGPSGPPGPPGADGTNGANGANGAVGSAGATGSQGPPGFDGAQGPQGETGVQGIPGLNGFDGSPPQSFRWTVDGVTFVCTDPDGDLHYECEEPEA